MIRTYLALVLICLLTTGCDMPEPTPEVEANAADESVGILLIGDTGYHLDYPDQDDYVDLFSAEEFQESEWKDWVEDMRPEAEFKARPSAISPVTGKVVAASGLHQVSVAIRDYCANYATCDFGLMLGDNIYPSGATLGAVMRAT